MYKGKTVSVVMPAYNEEDNIVQVINDFKRDFVDEIIVVDNNSSDSTPVLAKQAGARVVNEARQGQGYACIHALKEAKGDLIFITESDTTFLGKDMLKMLQYIDDCDMVIGSRVYEPLIGPKAMHWYTYIGNFFLAKLMQFLYGNRTKLNDIGVTFRLMRREALKKFEKKMRIGGPDWCAEPTILALKANMNVIQIPTWYMSRRGLSKQSPTIWHSLIIGLKHLWHILYRRWFD